MDHNATTNKADESHVSALWQALNTGKTECADSSQPSLIIIEPDDSTGLQDDTEEEPSLIIIEEVDATIIVSDESLAEESSLVILEEAVCVVCTRTPESTNTVVFLLTGKFVSSTLHRNFETTTTLPDLLYLT